MPSPSRRSTATRERPPHALRRLAVQGLYAITPTGPADAPLPESLLIAACAAVLRGGARVLQLRDKTADAARRRRLADALRALTRDHQALLFINDDAGLAAACGADGVHLGRDDAALSRVRADYPQLLVGVSCYDSLDLACEACAGGADYLAFGAVAASSTKPGAVRAPLALFAAARPLELPLVAIGGIDAGNAGAIVAAGADALAVVSALFDHDAPEAMARRLASFFPPQVTSP